MGIEEETISVKLLQSRSKKNHADTSNWNHTEKCIIIYYHIHGKQKNLHILAEIIGLQIWQDLKQYFLQLYYFQTILG